MSAEVLQGNGYTFSADVWSLGCVLYELCMLRSPFKSDKGVNLYDLFQKIKNGVYEPISERYSPQLRHLIHSMINLVPEKRPTMNEILLYSKSQNPFLSNEIPPIISQPSSDSPSAKLETSNISIKKTNPMDPSPVLDENQFSRGNSAESDLSRKNSNSSSKIEQIASEVVLANSSKNKYTNSVFNVKSNRTSKTIKEVSKPTNQDSVALSKAFCVSNLSTVFEMADTIVDHLATLDYASFCSKYCFQFVTPFIFIEPFRDPVFQSRYFFYLTSWLIGIAGLRPPEIVDDMNVNITSIILRLKQLNISIDCAPNRLQAAYGVEICSVLQKLLILISEKNKWEPLIPVCCFESFSFTSGLS